MRISIFAFAIVACFHGVSWSADEQKKETAKPPPQVAGIFDLANAPSIVFLCDSSGSMMVKFDSLRQQLRKAVDALHAGQSFNVTFMSERLPFSACGL